MFSMIIGCFNLIFIVVPFFDVCFSVSEKTDILRKTIFGSLPQTALPRGPLLPGNLLYFRKVLFALANWK